MTLPTYSLTATILVATLLFTAASCKKGDIGPAGPAGPAYTGNIAGFVSLFDQYGTKQLNNQSGIQVKEMETGKVATTDVNGKYEIDSLPTGNYTLQITDPSGNFAPSQVNQLQLIEGTVNHDVRLSARPNFALSTLSAVDTIVAGTAYIRLSGSLASTDTRARTLAIFVGSAPGTTSATSTYLLNVSKTVNANAITFVQYILPADLNGAGLASGSTAYFAVYPAGATYANASSYEDLSNGRTVYNAIGANAVTASALVP
ncbi:MAG: hypothetical protein ABI169_15005 [Chitinophagaceae bacterium]